jgi:hypothetical protein
MPNPKIPRSQRRKYVAVGHGGIRFGGAATCFFCTGDWVIASYQGPLTATALQELHSNAPPAEREEFTKNVGAAAVCEYKKHREVRPRNGERDAEIVRLRDQEGKSFGIIGRCLCLRNSAWVGRNGEPLTRDAVEAAYRRKKRSLTQP